MIFGQYDHLLNMLFYLMRFQLKSQVLQQIENLGHLTIVIRGRNAG